MKVRCIRKTTDLKPILSNYTRASWLDVKVFQIYDVKHNPGTIYPWGVRVKRTTFLLSDEELKEFFVVMK